MIKFRSSSEGEEKNDDPKKPEYIILEGERDQQSQESSFRNQSFGSGSAWDKFSSEKSHETMEEPYIESFQKLENLKFPLMLRVLSLIGSLFVFFISLFVLVGVGISLFFALITFFSNVEVNNSLKKTLYGFKKITAIWFGLFIASISPPLGFGLILLYFMLHKEKMNNAFFSRIYR